MTGRPPREEIVLEARHRGLSRASERARVLGDLRVVAAVTRHLLQVELVHARAARHGHRPEARAEQRDEVLARQITRERRAARETKARRVRELGRSVLAIRSDRRADGDELRDLMIAAPQVVLDLEANAHHAFGMVVGGLRAHAFDGERARPADRLAQGDDLAGRRNVDERLAAEDRAEEIDAAGAGARVGLEDAGAHHHAVRKKSHPRERQELRHREVGERRDRARAHSPPRPSAFGAAPPTT